MKFAHNFEHVHFTLAYLEYLKDFMLALNLSLMFILVHQKSLLYAKSRHASF